jgi:magnesium transporter
MSSGDHSNSTPDFGDYIPLDPDTGFSLNPEFVAEVVDAIEREDRATARNLVAPLPGPDQAELFDQLDQSQREWLTETLSTDFDSETLAHLSPEAAEDVMEVLGAAKSAEMLAEMEVDDAVHLIEDMHPDDQQEILEVLPEHIREEVEESLTYPEESAGRLMRHALVAVPESWTVGETIDYLRAREELPENFYVIYTVDASYRPTGRVLLGNMLGSKREVALATLLSSQVFAVATGTDQEEVAHMFQKYALVEAPVVNDSGRLVGTITVDDVVDVIEEEGEEDYLRAGGVTSQDFQSRIWETVRTRFWWLFVNLITAVLAANVIGLFQHSIERLVALAVVMPMVASMGGNTGTQSVTVAVRAIATRYLTEANAKAFIRKEMMIGMVNGTLLGIIMGLGAYLWFHDSWLSVVLCCAAIITMTMAGLFGSMIPILLHRHKIDPAISSAIFLTTVTDCTGFFSFLGLATLILLHHT